MQEIPEQHEHMDALSLGMSDKELISALSSRIRDSRSFWESDKKLKERREKLVNYWKGKHRTRDMYDYQYPLYIDNRVYMHTEHITQTVNAKLPEPVATPRYRKEQSMLLADNFNEYIQAYAEINRWRDVFRIATRNLLLEFQGIVKVRWDDMAGPISQETGKPLGDVVIANVQPKNIVVDKYARPYENPSFVAERMFEPAYKVLELFPDKKDTIKRVYGITDTTTAMIPFWEVHFTYVEKQTPKEATVWFSENLDEVLRSQKSSDWDDKGEVVDGEIVYRNLLDRPTKPYSFLSMNNLGKYFIDETTPIEQFLPMQDVLNQRGQQIKDMAEEQRGGKVFNKRIVDMDDAARFNNDPGSSLGVSGPPNEAYMKVTPDLLPNYVLEDKFDARQEGDNIIGVHGPTRGERQGSDQPTSIQLLKEGDFQRRGDLINGIERMAEKTYQYAAHLMKLNYTEEHWVAAHGDDGKKTYVMMTANNIESGLKLSIKAGTTLPTDEITQREEAMELMQLGKIDYITFYERLGFPNPREQAKKTYQHETEPHMLYDAGDSQEEAQEDVEMIKQGRMPDEPDEITDSYMATLISFMKGDEFGKLDDQKQNMFREYLAQITQRAKTQPQEQQPQGQQQGQQVQPQAQPQGQQDSGRGFLGRAKAGAGNIMERIGKKLQ